MQLFYPFDSSGSALADPLVSDSLNLSTIPDSELVPLRLGDVIVSNTGEY